MGICVSKNDDATTFPVVQYESYVIGNKNDIF